MTFDNGTLAKERAFVPANHCERKLEKPGLSHE
jgi:hypothetical protein